MPENGHNCTVEELTEFNGVSVVSECLHILISSSAGIFDSIEGD